LRSYLEKPFTKKDWWSVAQGVVSEFKSQYCKQNKTKKKSRRNKRASHNAFR
jgi:hypothetical protein